MNAEKERISCTESLAKLKSSLITHVHKVRLGFFPHTFSSSSSLSHFPLKGWLTTVYLASQSPLRPSLLLRTEEKVNQSRASAGNILFASKMLQITEGARSSVESSRNQNLGQNLDEFSIYSSFNEMIFHQQQLHVTLMRRTGQEKTLPLTFDLDFISALLVK